MRFLYYLKALLGTVEVMFLNVSHFSNAKNLLSNTFKIHLLVGWRGNSNRVLLNASSENMFAYLIKLFFVVSRIVPHLNRYVFHV